MKPDWNLIKKNFAETGKLIKESAKELLAGRDQKEDQGESRNGPEGNR